MKPVWHGAIVMWAVDVSGYEAVDTYSKYPLILHKYDAVCTRPAPKIKPSASENLHISFIFW